MVRQAPIDARLLEYLAKIWQAIIPLVPSLEVYDYTRGYRFRWKVCSLSDREGVKKYYFYGLIGLWESLFVECDFPSFSVSRFHENEGGWIDFLKEIAEQLPFWEWTEDNQGQIEYLAQRISDWAMTTENWGQRGYVVSFLNHPEIRRAELFYPTVRVRFRGLAWPHDPCAKIVIAPQGFRSIRLDDQEPSLGIILDALHTIADALPRHR